MGIIDFLQKYDRAKKIETKYLKMRNRSIKSDTFSCVDPSTYSERFH
jgi:hypothetical protein